MQINRSINGDAATLSIVGNVDILGCGRLRAACDEVVSQPGVETLVIDIAGVDYFNSSALGMLMLVRELVAKSGKKLRLHYPNERAWRVMKTANFQKLFTIERAAQSDLPSDDLCRPTA